MVFVRRTDRSPRKHYLIVALSVYAHEFEKAEHAERIRAQMEAYAEVLR